MIKFNYLIVKITKPLYIKMKTVIKTYLDSLSEDILILSIDSREITVFPDLSRFKNLKELYCSDNKLSSLPTTLPQSLEVLYCSKNKLISLPDLSRFKNLKELYCYKNKLTSLPTILPQTLVTLYCFDNKLTYLPSLPEKILYFYYPNNPICNILDINNNSLIKVKQNIKIVNNFRYLYFSLKFKKQLRKWLWEKVREKKIIDKYHPNYLLENLEENADLDKFLNNW